MLSPPTFRFKPPFAGQHVRLARRIVADGHWAALWRADTGNAVSLAPVLWLFAHGHEGRLATVKSRSLAHLSGLCTRTFRAALSKMNSVALIEMLCPPRPALTSFRVPAHLLSNSPKNSFYIPGVIVANGTWASLTPAEQCVLVALAATARRMEWCDDTYEQESKPFLEWLDSYGAVYDFRVLARAKDYPKEDVHNSDETYEYLAAHRVTRLSNEQLAALTGMHASSVSRAVARLVRRPEPLLAVYNTPEQRFYLLPPVMWGNTATRVEASQYAQPRVPR